MVSREGRGFQGLDKLEQVDSIDFSGSPSIHDDEETQ